MVALPPPTSASSACFASFIFERGTLSQSIGRSATLVGLPVFGLPAIKEMELLQFFCF